MLPEFTRQLQRDRRDLSAQEIRAIVPALLSGKNSDEDKAEFLLALRRKGETAAEISIFVEALLERAVDPGLDPSRLGGPLIDPCGTGGDSLDLFNVSTAAMFLLAAGGARVVKHGNRAVTSRSGGADVLEALGVSIRVPPGQWHEHLERFGFVFALATDYHPAFQAVAAVRRRLAAKGERSVFNLLGPLLNPARPPFQLTGVFAMDLLPVFAEVFAQLRRVRAWAVHGLVDASRGMDEISPVGSTRVSRAEQGVVSHGQIELNEFRLPAATSTDSLRGGGPEDNARIIHGILRAEISDARRDFVLMNAAAGFVVAGLARNLADGVELALAQINSRRAWSLLEAARAA